MPPSRTRGLQGGGDGGASQRVLVGATGVVKESERVTERETGYACAPMYLTVQRANGNPKRRTETPRRR